MKTIEIFETSNKVPYLLVSQLWHLSKQSHLYSGRTTNAWDGQWTQQDVVKNVDVTGFCNSRCAMQQFSLEVVRSGHSTHHMPGDSFIKLPAHMQTHDATSIKLHQVLIKLIFTPCFCWLLLRQLPDTSVDNIYGLWCIQLIANKTSWLGTQNMSTVALMT